MLDWKELTKSSIDVVSMFLHPLPFILLSFPSWSARRLKSGKRELRGEDLDAGEDMIELELDAGLQKRSVPDMKV
jgi:hypothetical protein